MKLGDIIKIIAIPGYYGGDNQNDLAIFINFHDDISNESLYEVLILKNIKDKLFLYKEEFEIIGEKNER